MPHFRKTKASTKPALVASQRTNGKSTAQATIDPEVRNASVRRRHADPTTCERDFAAAETEFMEAMQAYKQSSGRMFPTWSEVLEVLRSLGYQKV